MQRDESFEKFGRSFQNRVIQACLIDNKFFQQIVAICKPSYFNGAHETIWKVIFSYFEQYNTPPTYDSIKIELEKIGQDTTREHCKVIIKEIEANINQSEIEHVKDVAHDFCTDKEMEQAILDSVELLKDDKRDAIKPRIEAALKHVHIIDTGHEYFDRLEERSKTNSRKTVPTGLPMLDSLDFLEGGLGNGEIGMIMAPTGGGKSYWLVQLGYGGLQAGVDVVHYTFELSEVNIGRRYDSCITGIPIKMLSDNYDEVDKRLKDFKGGKLIIKEFPTRSANINKIKFHIDRLKASGFNPSLIILDYADLMRSTREYDQRTWELESIYEELRGYSMEIQVPIWTASQTNRSGLDEDIIGLDKIADAYAKAMVVDFMGTFSRNMFEKENSLGKFFIAKNRIGRDGKVFGVDFHPEIASIKLFELNDRDEQETLKEDIQSLFKEYKDTKGLSNLEAAQKG